MKIGIIGAGIFGTITALFLSKAGHTVSLYDSKPGILLGASGNNSNRLHLGFHYPRDLETAIQSKNGYEEFRKHFPDVCNFNFPCIYALSREQSKTSELEFFEFIKTMNIDAIEVNPSSLTNFSFDYEKISKAWVTKEGVVDMLALKTKLLKNLARTSIKVFLNTEIKTVSKSNQGWRLESHNREAEYDLVVVSTYGLDHIVFPDTTDKRSKSIFQATMILQARISVPTFGVTVIDGDFITVLPKGFSNESLIYAPSPSVLGESFDLQEVEHLLLDKSNITRSASLLKSRFREYFPNANVAFRKTKLISIRSINQSKSTTANRESLVEEISPNLVSIRSGKLDHAIEIANQIQLYAQ